jgi:DNA polymerase-3 subunit gamma/tau
VFATTEIRKVPVTVLSRCQRFDLRRIDSDVLMTHLSNILAKEGVQAEPEALGMIARAAEGSVRDRSRCSIRRSPMPRAWCAPRMCGR